MLHVYLLAALGFSLWNESTAVSLVTLSPAWKEAANRLQAALIAQLSIAAPGVIWLLVTFRRNDWRWVAVLKSVHSD